MTGGYSNGKRSLLALTVLVWASCGGSSGGNGNGDGGGVTAGDGAATGGTVGSGGPGGTGGTVGSGGPGGSTGSGGTSGGSGGTSGGSGGSPGGNGGSPGGYGGSGGTPSVCSDPMYPTECPARGDVPAICWSTGTDCSTITKCGNDYRSCTTPGSTYDCSTNTCVVGTSGGDGGVAACSGTGFPISCPARGDVPALCWSPGTVCSTINRCNNEFKSCQAAGYHFDCAQFKCVPDTAGGTPDAAATVDAGVVDTASAADTAAAAADAGAGASADAATHD